MSSSIGRIIQIARHRGHRGLRIRPVARSAAARAPGSEGPHRNTDLGDSRTASACASPVVARRDGDRADQPASLPRLSVVVKGKPIGGRRIRERARARGLQGVLDRRRLGARSGRAAGRDRRRRRRRGLVRAATDGLRAARGREGALTGPSAAIANSATPRRGSSGRQRQRRRSGLLHPRSPLVRRGDIATFRRWSASPGPRRSPSWSRTLTQPPPRSGYPKAPWTSLTQAPVILLVAAAGFACTCTSSVAIRSPRPAMVPDAAHDADRRDRGRRPGAGDGSVSANGR